MEGRLPEIYWYIFWIGIAAVSFGSAYLAGRAGHAARMKALDILKMYAEKGAEPPPAMVEQIAKQAFERPSGSPTHRGREALIQGFIGFLFMSCVSFGLNLWLADSEGPRWAVYASQAAWAFFGFGSFGFLVLALLTRDSK